MAKTFVLGDIHGNYKALIQVLKRSNFNYEEDVLIQLGDVADGYSQVYECVEELLKIKNLISIKGNHDDWFLEYLNTGIHPAKWQQGGYGTLKSYCEYADKLYDYKYYNSTGKIWLTSLNPEDIPISHINFFRNQLNYYIDEQNRCFVHGGFNRHFSIKEQHVPYVYYWDRDLFYTAMSYKDATFTHEFKTKDKFTEIYIGHTQTTNWKSINYIKAACVYNVDTGAGWNTGRLCMLNIDTKEAFYSDLGKDLYPNEQGR